MANTPEEWQKVKAAYEFVYFTAQYEGPVDAAKMPMNTGQNLVHLDEIIQSCLNIYGHTSHLWLGIWVDGSVSGWVHVKLVKCE